MKFNPRHTLAIACSLLLLAGAASCGTSKKAVRVYPSTETPEPKKHYLHLSRTQKKLVKEAETWIGTPYLYAGAEKGKGTDCSGFVMKVYLESCEMKLPRNSAKQAEFCVPIKEEEVEAGDLVFFATGKDPKKVSHVGMMVDAESFIHASCSKGVVVSKISSTYYRKRFLMYGRVPQLVSAR